MGKHCGGRVIRAGLLSLAGFGLRIWVGLKHFDSLGSAGSIWFYPDLAWVGRFDFDDWYWGGRKRSSL